MTIWYHDLVLSPFHELLIPGKDFSSTAAGGLGLPCYVSFKPIHPPVLHMLSDELS
jgi:hypothetical protein